MAISEELMKKISDNIKDASDNEYNIDDYTDEELAGDLLAYAEDCENETYEDILATVKEWRKNCGRTKTKT
jgi:hypothetical protein